MRITLILALGFMSLALTACPKKAEEADNSIPDVTMRKPDMSGAPDAAANPCAAAEAANPCDAAANPCGAPPADPANPCGAPPADPANPCGAAPANPCGEGGTPVPSPTGPGGGDSGGAGGGGETGK